MLLKPQPQTSKCQHNEVALTKTIASGLYFSGTFSPWSRPLVCPEQLSMEHKHEVEDDENLNLLAAEKLLNVILKIPAEDWRT
jgi:hypothetical protein